MVLTPQSAGGQKELDSSQHLTLEMVRPVLNHEAAQRGIPTSRMRECSGCLALRMSLYLSAVHRGEPPSPVPVAIIVFQQAPIFNVRVNG
jgi:hypothetical protein